MPSDIDELAWRSRLLGGKQHGEDQESPAGNQALTPNTASAHFIQVPTSDTTPIRLWDPVTSLPPEIAFNCLRESLPSGADFPAALIELTSVSSIWQDFLFSAPSLWAEIHVRYSGHDLMAIMSLFLHLSAETPLELIIWNELGTEWGDIKTLLLPHTSRILSLALGDDPPIYSDTPYAGAAYIALASDIFNTLHRLPSLASLDFGRALYVNPSQLKPLDLTSNIHVRNTISISLRDPEDRNPSIILVSGEEAQRNDSGVSPFKPSNTAGKGPMLSDFLPAHSRAHFDESEDSISSLSSSLISLASILASLDCHEPPDEASSSSSYMNFVNTSGNRCRLCNRYRGSLSAVLGCVRFHFGLRPFRCHGCRTCNNRKGYARFCTSHLLLNHIGPTTCAICGTQQTALWKRDIAGDPICSACNDAAFETVSFFESGGEAFRPADVAHFKSQRPAKERLHWEFDADNNVYVSSLLKWVEAMSSGLAALGLHKYLVTKSRGALVSNAEYRPSGSPEQPAFDWITFDQSRHTLDPTFQEGIATYDPSVTSIVYVFLVSPSGDSVGIWRREIPIAEVLRNEYAVELAEVNAYVSRKPHAVTVER